MTQPEPVEVHAKLSPSVIPFTQQWLGERGTKPQDPAALAQVIIGSLGSYIACYRKYPFFHQHDIHLFGALALQDQGKTHELHLPVLRNGSEWVISVPGELHPTEEYHVDVIRQEAAAIASILPND